MLKKTFIKAQASSFIASVVDYLVYILLISLLGVWYVPASAIGTIVGGIVNFMLGRNWVFQNREKKIWVQAFRYLLVWLGYFAIITALVFTLTNFLRIDYRLSKLMAGLIMGITYNYFLQKKFVYK